MRAERVVALLCAAFILALAGTAAAFRTASDSPELAGDGRVAWSTPDISFVLYGDSLPPGVSVEDVETALQAALQTWAAPACTSAAPVYVGRASELPQPKDGLNTIAWVSDWTARSFPASAAGNTDVQYEGNGMSWQIAGADVFLNANMPWSVTGEPNKRDVQTVLTHELGHALGLLHPCEIDGADGAPRCADVSASDATMYPIYDPEQVSLAGDDIAGICYLYPDSACGRCPPDTTCSAGQCVATCFGTACQPGEVCSYWRQCVNANECTGPDCTGAPCTGDSACGFYSRCVAGVCARGAGKLGGQCSASADCAGGVCVSGTCEPECSESMSCAQGTCTGAIEAPLSGCIHSGANDFGLPCEHGEDCASSICALAQTGDVCTQTCDKDHACPTGWNCDRVDGKDACIENVNAPGGGCQLGAGDRSPWPVFCGIALGVLGLNRRRRVLGRDR